jgi:hypothetical protein
MSQEIQRICREVQTIKKRGEHEISAALTKCVFHHPMRWMRQPGESILEW